MGRVRVSKVAPEARLAAITEILRADCKHPEAGWSYACGYLESAFARALDLLPPGKRELFLASLEKQVQPKKKVRNLMSGEEVEIDSDTPLCCDPSSETYWSM